MTPDDGVSDWGYGSPFRCIVLERQGDWVKLARRPFNEPVWLDAQRDLGRIALRTVKSGDLYTFQRRKLFILAVLKNGVRVRDEQENDSCLADENTVIKPSRPRDITLSELYDVDGHLLMTETYSRGC
jgi:hypothetical protein